MSGCLSWQWNRLHLSCDGPSHDQLMKILIVSGTLGRKSPFFGVIVLERKALPCILYYLSSDNIPMSWRREKMKSWMSKLIQFTVKLGWSERLLTKCATSWQQPHIQPCILHFYIVKGTSCWLSLGSLWTGWEISNRLKRRAGEWEEGEVRGMELQRTCTLLINQWFVKKIWWGSLCKPQQWQQQEHKKTKGFNEQCHDYVCFKSCYILLAVLCKSMKWNIQILRSGKHEPWWWIINISI